MLEVKEGHSSPVHPMKVVCICMQTTQHVILARESVGACVHLCLCVVSFYSLLLVVMVVLILSTSDKFT